MAEPNQRRPRLLSSDRPLLHSYGLAAWSLVGLAVAAAIVVYALAAVRTLVMPLVFAAVFAVLLAPVHRRIVGRGVPAALSAGIVVAVLFALSAAVVGVTVRGVIDQSDRIAGEIEAALEQFDVKESDIEAIRDRLSDAASGLGSGAMGSVAAGLSAVGEAVVALLLGVLIFYYFLKDGPSLRRAFVHRAPPIQRDRLNGFIEETFEVLRRYWLGRAIVSAIVAAVVGAATALLGLPLVMSIAVVTFIGGFIPYLGAIVGGAFAVVVALGSSGFTAAIVMLSVVLIANVLIENMVEPMVTGKTLHIHPLVVLLSTTAGATIAGISGMIMAVPIVVIGGRAIRAARTIIAPDAAGGLELALDLGAAAESDSDAD